MGSTNNLTKVDLANKRKTFIINFLYFAICIGIAYLVFKFALPLIMPFFIAFIIAFILKPLINFLDRKTPINRKIIAVVILILLYGILGFITVFAGAKIVVSLSNLFSQLPDYYKNVIEPAFNSLTSKFTGFVANLDPAIINFLDYINESIENSVSGLIGKISTGALGILTGIASSIPWIFVGTLLAVITSFFFVIDYRKITTFIVTQFSDNTKRRFFIIKDFVVNVLFKFAKAYLILISITFVELSIGFLILGVSNPFVIAIITAIVDIFPVLGTGTVLIPWAVYSFLVNDIRLGIGLLIIYAVITVVRQFIEPKIIGKQIGLYPLLTLICMYLGAKLFGFWGMFMLPISLTVIIHLNKIGEIHLIKGTKYQNPLQSSDKSEDNSHQNIILEENGQKDSSQKNDNQKNEDSKESDS